VVIAAISLPCSLRRLEQFLALNVERLAPDRVYRPREQIAEFAQTDAIDPPRAAS